MRPAFPDAFCLASSARALTGERGALVGPLLVFPGRQPSQDQPQKPKLPDGHRLNGAAYNGTYFNTSLLTNFLGGNGEGRAASEDVERLAVL